MRTTLPLRGGHRTARAVCARTHQASSSLEGRSIPLAALPLSCSFVTLSSDACELDYKLHSVLNPHSEVNVHLKKYISVPEISKTFHTLQYISIAKLSFSVLCVILEQKWHMPERKQIGHYKQLSNGTKTKHTVFGRTNALLTTIFILVSTLADLFCALLTITYSVVSSGQLNK